MNRLMRRFRHFATTIDECVQSNSTALPARSAATQHSLAHNVFAHCDQTHLARCDILRALHVITTRSRYGPLVRPRLRLFYLKPRTDLNLEKRNIPRFEANGVFKFQDHRHDCLHNLYNFFAEPRLRPCTRRS